MIEDRFPKIIPIQGRVRVCLEFLKEQGIKGKMIVDIGSSFGWLEYQIQTENPKKVIGIEPNKKVLDFAKSNVKKVDFLQGEASKTPLKSKTADIVCLFDVIEHIPRGSEVKVLNEVRRILKNNGTLLLSTPNNNFISNLLDPAWYFGHRHYSQLNIINLFKKTGFKLISIEKRGNIFSLFYLIWFYSIKILTGSTHPRSSFLEKIDDYGYSKRGFAEIFAVAKKI